ncbi:response regulator [Pontibaca salina]|uniref:Response regulator n=1 Tax=Pontibaca salina TaxID=2795731 RepID=A0A934HJE5_9RHOB|nr:response regulator [Pontibaca salina]MBI6629269.1 response regulator [Pontibaca salina]
MDDLDPFTARRKQATAARPLLGLTVLVVEDSRFTCDAIRLLCLRSGARIRRADCLAAARRHLKTYRPSVIIVDLGLPDGSGLDLISQLHRAVPRIGVIIGMSGDDLSENAVLAAGANEFLPKPITSLSTFQNLILSHLPYDRQPPGLRLVCNRHVHPDPLAYQDDMAQMAELLCDRSESQMIDYVAQFVRGVAQSAEDTVLAQAAADLASARAKGAPYISAAARVAALIQQRLQKKRAI